MWTLCLPGYSIVSFHYRELLNIWLKKIQIQIRFTYFALLPIEHLRFLVAGQKRSEVIYKYQNQFEFIAFCSHIRLKFDSTFSPYTHFVKATKAIHHVSKLKRNVLPARSSKPLNYKQIEQEEWTVAFSSST